MVWEQCLSISGPVLAAAGVYIAWQQKRMADIRLRHDLYDRKYRVYEAAKALLVNFQDNGALSQADYFNYLRGVADAIFLCNEDVEGYLKTIRDKATLLIRLQRNGAAAADESAEVEMWFTQQFGVLAS